MKFEKRNGCVYHGRDVIIEVNRDWVGCGSRFTQERINEAFRAFDEPESQESPKMNHQQRKDQTTMKINEVTGEVTDNGETIIDSAGNCHGRRNALVMSKALDLWAQWSNRPKLPVNWRRDGGCFCPLRCDGGPVAVYVPEEKPQQVTIFHRWVTKTELEQIPQVQKYVEWRNELKQKEVE